MKKRFTTLLIALLCSTIFAQTPQVKWGPIVKEKKKMEVLDIIGSDEDGTYFLKVKRTLFSSTYYIDKLNKNLERALSKELVFDEPEKIIRFNTVLYRNNKIEFFTSEINKETNTSTLYVQTINKKSLSFNPNKKKLLSMNFGDVRNWNSSRFSVRKSRDESKLLINYIPPYNRNKKGRFELATFNDSYEKLWSKKLALPYQDKDIRIKSSLIDNWGNYHLIVTYSNLTPENRNTKTRRAYEVISFTDEGRKMSKYPIKLKNHFVSQLQITVDKDKKILCGGFYSNENSSNVAGTFFMRINPANKKVEQESYKAFSLDFITEAMTEKKKEKAKKKQDKGKNVELYEYDLDELIIKGDGGVIMVGEQYYYYTTTSSRVDANGNWTTTTTNHYVYNDILIVNVAPNGTIDWAKKIPKRQHTTNDGGYASSYYLTVTQDKLYFIFNDHIKNIEDPEEGKYRQFTRGKYGAVAIASVDSKGSVDRNLLFKSKSISSLVRPKYCHQSDPNTTILYGTVGRFKQFGKLKFK